MATYDGVIVGAGHNGLTLGAYMARAGLRVAVLERQASIGGGTSTEESALPGFRFNLHSNFYIGFSGSPLVRDLELYRHGFAYVEPPVQQGVTLRDGTALTIHRDVDRSCASIARFSKRDADAFRDLHQTYAVRMRPFFTSLLYNPPLPPAELRARLTGPQGRELLSHAPLDLFGAVDRHFEDHRIRTFFKLFMHVTTGENEPGTGLIFPTIMSSITHLALPVGGSMAFALALARVIEAGGGDVITAADVREITVSGGRATGVRLADGRRIEAARFVASAIDAPATARLVGEEHFPDDVRAKLRAWHWGHHSLLTLHLALARPPAYASAAFDPDIQRAFNVFFGFDDTAQVVRCFEQCRRSEFPDHLMGNGACNTLFDPTYAPAGQHVAFWWPFAPYALPDGPQGWDRRKREYTERLLDTWRGYAPNLTRDTVLAAHLYTPLDLERRLPNMTRGAVRMGAYVPSQLGINRPHPALADNRTPVDGLYLCGSSCHGGGVNGAPGYNAANAIAADLGLARPWTPVPAPEWTG
jgi:phytoene dehydrogenase-like protein